MKLDLKIINLDGIFFEGQVDLLNITIASGNVTILAGHLPLISNIEISHMYFKQDGITKEFAIAGGTLFVTEKDCKIITTAVESKDEIDFERAKQAKERAFQKLNDSSDDIDRERAEFALKRAINRMALK